jgi:hypothetical protein
MRAGIAITVTPEDRRRLATVPRNKSGGRGSFCSRPMGLGTNAITRETHKDKTCVWRWQERFMREGVAGLTRDKTRPSRIQPLEREKIDRVLDLSSS